MVAGRKRCYSVGMKPTSERRRRWMIRGLILGGWTVLGMALTTYFYLILYVLQHTEVDLDLARVAGDGQQGVLAAMELDEGMKVEVGQQVAVHHQERPIQAWHRGQRPGRAGGPSFLDIAQLDAAQQIAGNADQQRKSGKQAEACRVETVALFQVRRQPGDAEVEDHAVRHVHHGERDHVPARGEAAPVGHPARVRDIGRPILHDRLQLGAELCGFQ